MCLPETLSPAMVSTRKLPANFDEADHRLFAQELQMSIPASTLKQLENVTINPAGMLFQNRRMLSESLPVPLSEHTWLDRRMKINLWLKNCLFKPRTVLAEEVVWFTDIWSSAYFHWMTDALCRLFVIREEVVGASLLLPKAFRQEKFTEPSLKPFGIREVRYLDRRVLCERVRMPTHTAPMGHYNDEVLRALRRFYTDYYQTLVEAPANDRIYVSRSKAQKRKILNEAEVIEVVQRHGFRVVSFEDCTFEEQAKCCLNARYLVSNHGAGLTNMLYLRAGGSVLEMRRRGDDHNNCYFSLASAMQLNYFYQLCDAENFSEDTHYANLTVDCQLLERNLDKMLAA